MTCAHDSRKHCILYTPDPADIWLASHTAVNMIYGLQSWPRPWRVDIGALIEFNQWAFRTWDPHGPGADIADGVNGPMTYQMYLDRNLKYAKIIPFFTARLSCKLAVATVWEYYGEEVAMELHRQQALKLKELMGFPFACPN
jgi:hypothetical protein